MAYTDAQKHAVRAAYIYERKTLEQLAKLHGVNVRTLARWKKEAEKDKDDWDKARTAYSVSAQGTTAVAVAFLENLMLMCNSTMEEIEKSSDITALEKVDAVTRLSDAYNKAMAAANKHAPELSKISVALEVLHDLVAFVRENAPQHAQAMLEVLDPFGVYISKRY